MQKSRQEFFKVREAAEILGISRASLYEMIRENMIKVHRFGERGIRIHCSDFQQFIENAKSDLSNI